MSTIFRRGKRGIFQYQQDHDSVPRSLKTSNELEAKRLQNKFDGQIFNSETGLIDRSKTWDEFRDEHYFPIYKATKAHLSFVKLQQVERDFRGIVRPGKLSGITRQHCEAWQAVRLGAVSGNTVNTEKSYLSPMFAYAHNSGFIERNPMAGMMTFDYVKPEPKSLAPLEAEAFLAKMAELAPAHFPLGIFAHDTGMRLDELIHQRPGDVDLKRHVLRVAVHAKTCPCIQCDRAEAKAGRRGWVPKTRTERDVPLTPVLEAILAIRKPEGGVYFPIGESTLGALFSRIHQAAGVTGKARVHIFRHTMVTALGRAGVRRAVIMKMIGHSPENSTDGYDHVEEWELHDAIKKLLAYRERMTVKTTETVVEGLRVTQAA